MNEQRNQKSTKKDRTFNSEQRNACWDKVNPLREFER